MALEDKADTDTNQNWLFFFFREDPRSVGTFGELVLAHHQVPDQILGPFQNRSPVLGGQLQPLPFALAHGPPLERVEHVGLLRDVQSLAADDHVDRLDVQVFDVLTG